VLPVGLVYEDKEHFRSRVLVQVGEPIDPAPDQAVYARAPREAVKSLTARIAAGLSSVTAPSRPGRRRASSIARSTSP
jgi:hypothetical protein